MSILSEFHQYEECMVVSRYVIIGCLLNYLKDEDERSVVIIGLLGYTRDHAKEE